MSDKVLNSPLPSILILLEKVKIKNKNQLLTNYLGFFSTLIVNDFLLGLGTKCTSGSLIILLWSIVFPPRSIVFVVLLLLGQVFMHPDQETIKTPLENSVNRELSMKLKQQENIITGLPVSTFIFQKKKKKKEKKSFVIV